jgi:hypothetical protein
VGKLNRESVKVALLKEIVAYYPFLSIYQVAAPSGYGISGRNRLNELSKKYKFFYEYRNRTYDFSFHTKARFRKILRLEEGK